jgi:8-oxo-dGTP pyrophosphatase MutT (NUDIX family)
VNVADAELSRWCAAGLLATPDGRYLMQLRDAKPSIFIPDHWGLFGGSIEPGETPAEALRRELLEELEFKAVTVEPFYETIIELPLAPPRFERMSFLIVPIEPDDLAAMVQHEGAAKRLFTPEELMAQPRISPWDLAAILMHARRSVLFAPLQADRQPSGDPS